MTRTATILGIEVTIPNGYPDAPAAPVDEEWHTPRASILGQWQAARAEHSKTLEDSMEWNCYDGSCGHADEFECPTIQIAVCSHCYALVMEDGRETAPSSVVWPCDTAKALGAVTA